MPPEPRAEHRERAYDLLREQRLSVRLNVKWLAAALADTEAAAYAAGEAAGRAAGREEAAKIAVRKTVCWTREEDAESEDYRRGVEEGASKIAGTERKFISIALDDMCRLVALAEDGSLWICSNPYRDMRADPAEWKRLNVDKEPTDAAR